MVYSTEGENEMNQPKIVHWSWKNTIPQFVTMFFLIVIVYISLPVVSKENSIFFGILLYLIYSIVSRMIIPLHHRNGIRAISRGKYQKAIEEFNESYDFFSRHRRIDKFRSIVLMSPSIMSYKEMALVNIAFAYNQLDDRNKAKEYYKRTIKEFPNSAIAKLH